MCPDGGHVLWVQLPSGVDAMDLINAAAEKNIRIAPAPMFLPSNGYRNFIRLNTGFCWSGQTAENVRTLGQLVGERKIS